MIGSNEITATAETGYNFSTWGTLPETVTEDLNITATFAAAGYLLTFTPRDETNNTEWGSTISESSYVVTEDWLYLYGNDSYDDNLHISTDPDSYASIIYDFIVTVSPWYTYGSWKYYDEGTGEWKNALDSTPIDRNFQIRFYATEQAQL